MLERLDRRWRVTPGLDPLALLCDMHGVYGGKRSSYDDQ